MGREREFRKSTLNSADDSSQADTGMLKYDEQYSINTGTNRDVSKLKWQYK